MILLNTEVKFSLFDLN